MKTAKKPTLVNSGDYLEQALYKGLTESQIKYAKSKVMSFKRLGLVVPYGIIRKISLEQHHE